MSQSDVWQTPDGQKGLEIGRNDKELYLSVINPAWPFPVFPVWYKNHNVVRCQVVITTTKSLKRHYCEKSC